MKYLFLTFTIALAIVRAVPLQQDQGPFPQVRDQSGPSVQTCNRFNGKDAGEKIGACIAALPGSGGTADARGVTEGDLRINRDIFNGASKPITLLLGAATYVFTTSSRPASRLSIIGSGTTIRAVGSEYLFDTAGGSNVVDDVSIEGLRVEIAQPNLGFLRVGRTSEDYRETYFRARWNLRNLYILGPGASVVGSTGISLTQYINWSIENVTILGFERAAILDRGGNSHWDRVRFQAFKFGPKWSRRAGAGSPADGSSMDVCTSCEFLGPTTTGPVAGIDFGYTVEIDAEAITFVNALYEAQPASGSSQGLIHIMKNGARFRDIGGILSWHVEFPRTLVRTMVFDDQYFQPTFLNTILTVAGFPPISFGSPSAPGATAAFVSCSSELNLLVNSQALGKATVIGSIDNHVLKTTSELHDHDGVLRMIGRRGVPQTMPLHGSGLQIEYEEGANQGILSAYDADSRTFKPLRIKASTATFDSVTDVRIEKRVFTPVHILAPDDPTPSVDGGNIFRAASERATFVTNFKNGQSGQLLTILFANDNTILVHGPFLKLAGGRDFQGTSDDVITLVSDMDGVWKEVSRSVN